MAKVTGPLLSMCASGSVGHALVFRSMRPNVLVQHFPSGPRVTTARQAAVRQRAGWAAEKWRALTSTERQQWSALAARRKNNPFAEYLAAFMRQRCTLTKLPLIQA